MNSRRRVNDLVVLKVGNLVTGTVIENPTLLSISFRGV